MKPEIAWNNVLAAAKKYVGNGEEWELLFASIQVIQKILDGEREAGDQDGQA